MNPTEFEILTAINSGNLPQVIRGEMCVFATPPEINDDMRPTDHDQLLIKGIYPLAGNLGASSLEIVLEQAVKNVCVDALGVYCAFQLFLMEVINENEKISPLKMDKGSLPHFLALSFVREMQELCSLEIKKGDLANKRPYKVTWSRMNRLARDYSIDWGMPVPPLLNV